MAILYGAPLVIHAVALETTEKVEKTFVSKSIHSVLQKEEKSDLNGNFVGT